MSKRKKSSQKHALQVRSETSLPSALNLRVLAGITLIAAAAFIAYFPSISGGFVMDDDKLITQNQNIMAPDGLWRFWCTTKPAEYWPVTNTTLWIEWRLWGMNSTGYHVTNLILHIAESLLIWFILWKLSIPGAFLAAMIFAVHPVNVESVAWIAQRKNMMAMLFFLLSILCYLKMENLEKSTGPICSQKPPGRSGKLDLSPFPCWYWLSLVAFLLATLSKGSVVILPILLLGIIWWLRPLTKWDLLRAAPFFAIAVVLTIVNMWFQTHGQKVEFRTATFAERLVGAGSVVWFYFYKAFLPIDLAFIYPQWHIEAGKLMWWLPLFAASVVTALLWLYRKTWSRPLLFAWGFFCVALIPVLGFTDVAFMQYSLVADHYQHIAIIGLIALVAAGWGIWHRSMQGGVHKAATAVAVLSVGALLLLTWRQSGLYRDAISLYQDTLEKNPECWAAHNNLGYALSAKNRLQEEIEHYEQALRLKPDFADAHLNLGVAMVQIGRPQEGIKHFQRAVELHPLSAEAHNNLGNLLLREGRVNEAIEHLQQALKLNPNYLEAHFILGAAFIQANRLQEAIEHFQTALSINPNFFEAHSNLGIALVQTGQTQEGIEHIKQALQIYPDYSDAYYYLAATYAQMRQSSEAIAAAQKALELARSQGQSEQAKHIEDWLNSYRSGLSDLQQTPQPSKSVPSTP